MSQSVLRGASAVLLTATALVTVGCQPSRADPAATNATNATVLRVVDGDTIAVNSDQRGRLKVRIIGLDTPETTVS
ncbi:hypothetical protein ONA92_26180 [Mycobacteroides salmoniphilum]|uniref:thermonuclease family protein n=1 Tax=Mycobacteroides salmoniphilum TaxID=404941 RepID=UPI00356453FE